MAMVGSGSRDTKTLYQPSSSPNTRRTMLSRDRRAGKKARLLPMLFNSLWFGQHLEFITPEGRHRKTFDAKKIAHRII
jgi:hypothetical protein